MIDLTAFYDELQKIAAKRYLSVSPRVKKVVGFKHKPGPASDRFSFENIHAAAAHKAKNDPTVKAMREKVQAGWDEIHRSADEAVERTKARRAQMMAELREKFKKMEGK